MTAKVVRQTLRLVRVQIRLLGREPQVAAFVFAFPVVTVLILGGVFDADDPAFEGVTPSDYYAAAYVGVVLSAIGLITIPVQYATYRESGVLRRFSASGFNRWAFPMSQFIVGMFYAAAGTLIVMITAAMSYGLPPTQDLGRTAVGVVIGTFAFVSIGVLLGSVMPNPRAAQGLGLILFFAMFLLAGAGPPPDAMPAVMKNIADALPLTHVIRSVQEPWLDIGSPSDHLAATAFFFVAATAGWVGLLARRAANT